MTNEGRHTRFMRAARGLQTHIVGSIMGTYGTQGISWIRSKREHMAEAYAAGEIHGSKVREDVIAKLKHAPRGVGLGDVKHVLLGGKLAKPVPPPAPPRERERTALDELYARAESIEELHDSISISQHGLKGRARINFKLGMLALQEAALRIRLALTEL